MGVEAGGYTMSMEDEMCFPYADCYDYSTETIVGDTGSCLLVNAEGVRFVDESLDRYTISGALMQQTDEKCYIISDVNNCKITDGVTQYKADEEYLLENERLFRADTLEELAELIDIDPDTLVNTVDTYNAYASAYYDEKFGRTLFNDSCLIETGPFYASPRTWAAHITIGGLVYSSNYEVMTEEGEAIPGLYVIGEAAWYEGGINVMGQGLVVADAIVA